MRFWPHPVILSTVSTSIKVTTAILGATLAPCRVLTLPELLEVLGVRVNYPHEPLGLDDLLALPLELLLRKPGASSAKPARARRAGAGCPRGNGRFRRASARGAVDRPAASSARCAGREPGPGACGAIPRSPRRSWRPGRSPIRWSSAFRAKPWRRDPTGPAPSRPARSRRPELPWWPDTASV